MTDTTLTRAEPKKYEYIDVMRGLAILLVIITHTPPPLNPDNSLPLFPYFSFGQMGVQLFFVASALTLYLSMQSRGLTRREIVPFYLRRFFRIAPLYYFAILFYLLIYIIANPFGTYFHQFYTVKTVLSNFLFLHGFYKPGNNGVVPGGWSIGCEMLFYSVFPAIFCYVNTKKKALWFILFAFVLNIFVQLLIARLLHKPLAVKLDSFGYFLVFNQLPVFGCGIVLYFLLRDSSHLQNSWNHVWKIAFFVALTLILWNSKDYFGLTFSVIPITAGFAFVSLGLLLSQANLNNFPAKCISEIGRKSFSIYIFHFIFVWGISRSIISELRINNFLNGYFIYALSIFLSVGLTYLVASFTNRFIEDRGIKLGKKTIENYKQSRRAS